VSAENTPVEDLTVVVTGASSGIGLAAGVEFARRGARVALVGRNQHRLAAAAARVAAAGGRAPAAYRADFTRLADVRDLAATLAETYPRIDVLANNAGGVHRRYTTTADGHEATVQANHLAPFLLTSLLRDRLRGGRVVNTASVAHYMGRVDPDDFAGRGGPFYSLWRAYAASKCANVMFAAEAARRWPDVLSTSFHPGVVRTRFGYGTIAMVFYKVTPLLTTPARGADTLVWLATAPAGELTPGGYYYRRTLYPPAPPAADPDACARLWEASTKAVGL
jgi:NAD(P)-dependent dehydrogenase (short-subunit alcohol dehydrogenase family)